jgi:hypothetical protein
MSESSLYVSPIAANLHALRLPSFSASSTSKGWKASVMESLKITSLSISNLRAMKHGCLHTNHTASSTEGDTSTPEQQAELEANQRRSSDGEDEQSPVVQQPATLTQADHSTPDAVHDNNNEAQTGVQTTTPTVHLYNMRISHHLRSQSASTSAAPTRTVSPIESKLRHSISTSVAFVPSRRHQRQMSSSGFASADVPDAWGKVVKDEASSIYSSAIPNHIASPVDSKIDLPKIKSTRHVPESAMIERPTDTSTPEDAITPVEESAESEAIELESKPSNQGSSTLQKTSRFNEDFKAVGSKRASRHRSLISLFQSKKKFMSYSDSMGTMDGSIDDEPRRLQRAIALSEKHNATGLMASAIKQNRDEKAALLLPGHKDQADHAGVRERSHSVSRPRTLSTASGVVDIAGPSCPTPQLGRRSRSAALLKPEFSTPVFSHSPLSLPSEQRMKDRALSVALDPIALAPGPTPAFQLNDAPFDVSSEPSTITLPALPSFVFDNVSAGEDYQDFENPNVDLGAWARYPSHTRAERTGPAGPADNVKTRDFAYYPNVTVIVESSGDEDTPAGKKRKRSKKKNRARTGIPKSRSMTFARETIRKYVKNIFAPNVEYLKYGHGHRSSVSTGGKLKHPELEIIPPVFAAMPVAEEGPAPANSENGGGIEMQVLTPRQTSMARRASLASRRLSTTPPECDGAASDDEDFNEVDPIRKARRSVSSPSLPVTPGPESMYTQNNAQFWSRMYESCVELPRFSVSADQSVSHSRQVSLSSHHSSSDSQEAASAQAMPLLIDEVLATMRFSTEGQKAEDSTPNAAVQGHTSLTKNTLRARSRSGSPSSQSLPAKLGHGKKESVMSMQSIRESSMDLWKLLKETEEKERMKLMGL